MPIETEIEVKPDDNLTSYEVVGLLAKDKEVKKKVEKVLKETKPVINYHTTKEIEEALDAYYDSKGGHTPLLVELADLKKYLKEKLEG